MKIRYQTLYTLWATTWVLTAALGLIRAPQSAMSTFMTLLSIAFFLPPWIIIHQAKKEDKPAHLRLIRYLAIGWLVLTTVLLCANILSAGQSETAGNLLYTTMTIACTPLVCSNYFALPIFLWGTVLVLTKQKK